MNALAASALVAILYSPTSNLANFDRDGLRAPELAAAANLSEEDVYKALPGLVRANLVTHHKSTDTYSRSAEMLYRQLGPCPIPAVVS